MRFLPLLHIPFLVQCWGTRAAPSLNNDQVVFQSTNTSRHTQPYEGLSYELVSHPSFVSHRLRVKEPSLCDPTVKQYSGYLDISQNKHLFFWFFESRESPDTAPLILWLNGGPGCSSSTGLLFELGPCNIVDDGLNTTFNPYSWNAHANIIFLDQPVDVGFSYSDDDTTIDNSPAAGLDVYAFLQLFYSRFPKYAKKPFHIAAESYGGVYAPNFASVIHKQNKKLLLPSFNPDDGLKHVPLASVILANGFTDPYIQMSSFPDYVCKGPYPLHKLPGVQSCETLYSRASVCTRLIEDCYESNTRATCTRAEEYCFEEFIESFVSTLNVNPYDVRKACENPETSLICYPEVEWVDKWMNNPANKRALGAKPSREFTSCSAKVNEVFIASGDPMHRAAALLPELVEDGVRLLVYAGVADLTANYIGNERWVAELETSFKEEFSRTKSVPWITVTGEKIAGEVRSAGGGGFTAGNVTFVSVYEAGHLVPHDQPKAALDLITRWIMNVPLAL